MLFKIYIDCVAANRTDTAKLGIYTILNSLDCLLKNISI